MTMTASSWRLTPLSLAAAMLMGGLVGASPAQAQDSDFLFKTPRVTWSVHAGLNRPSTSSEVFDFTREFLTVEQGDFQGLELRTEIGFRVAPRFDIAVDLGFVRSSVISESRDFIGTDDLPIVQETSLSQIPFTINGKFYLNDRGRSVGQFAWIPGGWAPYIGGGVGIVSYDFVQEGEFVIEETLDIVRDRLDSGSTGSLIQLLGGVEIPLGARMIAVLDGRYRWSSAGMRSDWIAFDDIDLSGLSVTAGFAVRF